jgi:outer membrane receptor for ferrienterochelin and colicin
MRRFLWIARALFLLVLGAAPAAGQRQSTHVHGTVVDAAGQPVGSVTVELADPLGAVLQQTTTAADGQFSFADVAPGRFTIRTQSSALAGESASVSLTVEAALPLDVLVRLPPRITEAVQVEGVFSPGSTRFSLAGESLASVPVRIRGRSLQDAIATLPGWATEDNGLLHTRGVDDGFVYVIDGVPVYERLDALNGLAPDTESLESINVITGYVAPEFGYKAGGVIDVRTRSAASRWRGTGDFGSGSYATTTGGVMAGGDLAPGVNLRLGGSALYSDRFLDPVDPDNLHNTGSQTSTTGGLDIARAARDRVSVGWALGQARYDVPNTLEQEEAGQDQREQVWNGSVFGSWQRVWSNQTIMHMAAYHRRSGVELDGSEYDLPVFAESTRTLARTGGIVGVTHQRGNHLFKAGVEGQALQLDEDFTFFVTDEEEGEEAGLSEGALEHDADNPFAFTDRASPSLWSIYVQDTWQIGARATLGAGVRFDQSTLLLDRHQWSPRAGAAFQLTGSTTVRASVSRFFQPTQPEYILLSSSEQARDLSPFEESTGEGGADVEPERQWAFEAGITQQFKRWRLDAAYWRRDGRSMADPNVFFGTTIIFPNAVDKGRAQGLDVRLEVPQWRSWSGYASATVGKVIQTAPITGGLFLEDEIADLEPGEEFLPDHDQRVALAGGATWNHDASGATLSAAVRYESGTPLQRDEDDEGDLEERPGAEMVDFDRGRVKPRFLVSLIASFPLVNRDRIELLLRGSLLNLFDDNYAYNFGNPFSGTHFGAPRTAAVGVQVNLK